MFQQAKVDPGRVCYGLGQGDAHSPNMVNWGLAFGFCWRQRVVVCQHATTFPKVSPTLQ